MNLSRTLRLVAAGLIAAALPIGAVLAQSPAPRGLSDRHAVGRPVPIRLACAGPSASPAAEASPVPAPSASPTSSASPLPAPSAPPAAAQTPATPPPAVQTADPFGEAVTLELKKVVTIKGTSNWPMRSTR